MTSRPGISDLDESGSHNVIRLVAKIDDPVLGHHDATEVRGDLPDSETIRSVFIRGR